MPASSCLVTTPGLRSAGQLRQAADAKLTGLFDDLSEALLTDVPEGATFLGLDKGKRAALKSRLSDQSWAHVSRDHSICADWLGKLGAIPDTQLSADATLSTRR